MNSVLNPMLSKEIDNLSDDSDTDFDDYTIEKVCNQNLQTTASLNFWIRLNLGFRKDMADDET